MPVVLNRYKLNGLFGEYCGRGTPFGNPFPAKLPRYRHVVCDMFEEWLYLQPMGFIVYATKRLRGKNLVCSCAPLRCHCDAWLRIVNDEKYIERNYPVSQDSYRSTAMHEPSAIINDLNRIKTMNPVLVETYGQTPAKLAKDNNLLTIAKHQKTIKRYCTQLCIFNMALCGGECSVTHYYHQFYFEKSISVFASMDECRFNNNDLLAIHVASLLFFNTIATLATNDKITQLEADKKLLDKFTPLDFTQVKNELIKTDQLVLPGCETTITLFLQHFKNALDLQPSSGSNG